jgi:hypothetical protein
VKTSFLCDMALESPAVIEISVAYMAASWSMSKTIQGQI